MKAGFYGMSEDRISAAFKTINLEKFFLRTFRRFDPVHLHGAKLEVCEDAARSMALELRGYIWSEKLREVSVTYPADWLEAVKQRFAPAWILKRWPVRVKTEVLTAKALYPLVSMPDERHSIQILKSSFEI